MLGHAGAQIELIGADSARNFSLSQLVVDTDALPLTDIFIFNAPALDFDALIPGNIPTAAQKRTMEFLFGQTASTRTTLDRIEVSTVAQPLSKPFFIHEQSLVVSPLEYSQGLIQDRTPPVLGDVRAENITGTSAQIMWTTDEFSDSKVLVGTEPGIWPIEETSRLFDFNHSLNITDLHPAAVYYYKAVSADREGNSGESAVMEFLTEA